jgi:uracil-DNA glycosylase family 4
MHDVPERNDYLHRMGIDQWVLRGEEHGSVSLGASPADRPAPTIATMGWEALENAVQHCQRCALYQTRTQAVFGVGRRDADLLIIGEAPGMNEDKQGEPFVGRAGQLLNAMLVAIGLKRSDVYIANILKSRPPRNRDPSLEEVASCTPYLLRQITLIRPKVLVALGKIAAQYLLSTIEPMSQLRGRQFEYGPFSTPLLVSYHPAYLLRSPREKRKAWQDMQQLHGLLQKYCQ